MMLRHFIKNKKRLLSVGVIALMVLIATPCLPVLAQENSPVGVFSAPSVAVGEQVAVIVEIQDVTNLYGYQLVLHFDPDLLSVVDEDLFSDGIQVELGTFLTPGIVLINNVDLTAGTVQVVLTQMNPSEAVSGSGTLFTVRFIGLANGVSPLTIDDLTLSDRDGFEIPSLAEDSQLTIGSGGTWLSYFPVICQSGSGLTSMPDLGIQGFRGSPPIQKITSFAAQAAKLARPNLFLQDDL